MRLVLAEICEFDIPEIDNGHDRIVLMINEIGDCIESGDYDTALRQVIHLIAVERKHLQTEMRLLTEYGYQKIDDHSRYHTELNDVLNRLMVALGDAEINTAVKIFDELVKGFIEDILKADLPFKSLLQYKMKNA